MALSLHASADTLLYRILLPSLLSFRECQKGTLCVPDSLGFPDDLTGWSKKGLHWFPNLKSGLQDKLLNLLVYLEL